MRFAQEDAKYQPEWPESVKPILNPLKFKGVGPVLASTGAVEPAGGGLLVEKVQEFVEWAVTTVCISNHYVLNEVL